MSLLFLAIIAGATGLLGTRLPGGFLPEEDQGYIFAGLQLPDASSLQRTDVVTQQVEKIIMKHARRASIARQSPATIC